MRAIIHSLSNLIGANISSVIDQTEHNYTYVVLALISFNLFCLILGHCTLKPPVAKGFAADHSNAVTPSGSRVRWLFLMSLFYKLVYNHIPPFSLYSWLYFLIVTFLDMRLPTPTPFFLGIYIPLFPCQCTLPCNSFVFVNQLMNASIGA